MTNGASGRRLRRLGFYVLVLLTVGILFFPFYWMTITSFKNEDQMRSLVSMFWPSPFVTDNYQHGGCLAALLLATRAASDCDAR